MKTLSSKENGTYDDKSRKCKKLSEKRGQSSSNVKEPLIKSINNLKVLSVDSQKHSYKDTLLNNHDNAKSQSLPDCFDEGINKLGENFSDNCDINSKLLNYNSPPRSPTNDVWFKTWPERCDKLKTNEQGQDNYTREEVINGYGNTHSNCTSNTKNKLTLNQALQNISLAYSPVTRQLHLIEKPLDELSNESSNIESKNVISNTEKEDLETKTSNSLGEINPLRKLGHRRTEAGSFSSTVSTISTLSGISDTSVSGSLLGSDDRSSRSLDITTGKTRKKSITNFFTRNVFSWKSGGNNVNNHNTSVWNLFGKHCNSTSNSPIRVVASSSALIQHERPSSLPAKTLEEEQRHREEYKAIIAAAKKKEAKDSEEKQKQQKLQLQMEEQQAISTKHFTHHVLPNWEIMRTTKKTQELWWQGLPSSVRGKVWRLAIGNELNVTCQLYDICLCRAQTRLNSPVPPKSDSNLDPESSMDAIQLDISRTFPHLCIFQEGGPYSETLHSLLAAYVCYRPDVGYVQGMSYIAAILILNMEQFDAFICFANLLNQPLHLSAFTLNQTQMQAYYDAYNEVFRFNLPKLYSHFENSGLTPDLYLLDWIYTIFAKAMPLDIACRVWDIFLRDGYEFIFRTALGILHLNQDVLMEMDFLHGAQFLTHLPDDMSSDQLFKSIQLVSTTIGKRTFTQIVDKLFSTCSQSS